LKVFRAILYHTESKNSIFDVVFQHAKKNKIKIPRKSVLLSGVGSYLCTIKQMQHQTLLHNADLNC
jgi:hypothetical protein